MPTEIDVREFASFSGESEISAAIPLALESLAEQHYAPHPDYRVVHAPAVLRFPAGDFTLDRPLRLQRRIALRGAGAYEMGTTLRFIHAADGSDVRMSAGILAADEVNAANHGDSPQISDLEIINQNPSGNSFGAGVDLCGGTHVSIRNCRILNWRRGVVFDGTLNAEMHGCLFSLIGRDVAKWKSDVTHVWMPAPGDPGRPNGFQGSATGLGHSVPNNLYISRCDFNARGVAFSHDSGVQHIVRDCSFGPLDRIAEFRGRVFNVLYEGCYTEALYDDGDGDEGDEYYYVRNQSDTPTSPQYPVRGLTIRNGFNSLGDNVTKPFIRIGPQAFLEGLTWQDNQPMGGIDGLIWIDSNNAGVFGPLTAIGNGHGNAPLFRPTDPDVIGNALYLHGEPGLPRVGIGTAQPGRSLDVRHSAEQAAEGIRARFPLPSKPETVYWSVNADSSANTAAMQHAIQCVGSEANEIDGRIVRMSKHVVRRNGVPAVVTSYEVPENCSAHVEARVICRRAGASNTKHVTQRVLIGRNPSGQPTWTLSNSTTPAEVLETERAPTCAVDVRETNGVAEVVVGGDATSNCNVLVVLEIEQLRLE